MLVWSRPARAVLLVVLVACSVLLASLPSMAWAQPAAPAEQSRGVSGGGEGRAGNGPPAEVAAGLPPQASGERPGRPSDRKATADRRGSGRSASADEPPLEPSGEAESGSVPGSADGVEASPGTAGDGGEGSVAAQQPEPAQTETDTFSIQASSVPAPSATGSFAFSSPTYEGVTVGAAPSPRLRAGAAHDQVRETNVLFGGFAGGTFLADTWTFDGTRWASRSSSASPSPRAVGGQVAYLPGTDRTILFGGWNGSTDLNDTWSWNGSSWSQLSPAVRPPARAQGTLAYSSALGKLVLFGGFGGGSYLTDTWTFDGTNWVQITGSVSPPGRVDAAMADDVGASRLVLYGGRSGSTYLGDTWVLTASGWAEQAPTHHPGLRAGHGLAYSPVLQRLVMFGGRDTQYTYNTTWLWTGSNWRRGAVPLSPTFRNYMVMVPAAANGQLLVFGGADSGNNALGDTHLYDWRVMGDRKGATAEGDRLTDRLAYQVDVARGNVVVTSNDLSLPGVGVGLELTRYYNAKAPSAGGRLGRGWSFTTGRDVFWNGLPDGSRVLHGVAGSAGQWHFVRQADGSYSSPAGSDVTMVNVSGGGLTVTENASRRQLTFGAW